MAGFFLVTPPSTTVQFQHGLVGWVVSLMNKQKPSGALAPQTFAKLATCLDRTLSFYGSGWPEMKFLEVLDRIVRLSLETPLQPFIFRERPLEKPVFVPGRRFAVLQPFIDIVASSNTASPATMKLAALLKWQGEAFQQFDPSELAAKQLAHAPHLQLLLDVYFSRRFTGWFDTDNFSFPDAHADDGAAANGWVTQFRHAMQARKFLRRELHSWNLSSCQNVPNLHAYLDNLFVQHGSLTVLHLRLMHTRRPANLITASVEEQHSYLRALRACRTRFFDRMRRKPALFTAAPAYVWAILPSLEGGYDLHLTLLFNTAALRKVLEDRKVEAELAGAAPKDLVDAIGAYWVGVGTKGEGSYLRGDRCAWLYGPDWVDGEVHADDVVRCEKLKEVLGLMAMRRALVRLKNEPDGEYFGMQERKARSPRRSRCGGTEAS